MIEDLNGNNKFRFTKVLKVVRSHECCRPLCVPVFDPSRRCTVNITGEEKREYLNRITQSSDVPVRSGP